MNRNDNVNHVCEALWGCSDARTALTWLDQLCIALKLEQFDSYDPAEAFLAIQGVALRFAHGDNNDNSAASAPPPLDANAPTAVEEHPRLPATAHSIDSKTDGETDLGGGNEPNETDSPREKCPDGDALLQTNTATLTTKSLIAMIYEKTLWTVATLARVCVGPAWSHQVCDRGRLRTLLLQTQQQQHGVVDPASTCELLRAKYRPMDLDHDDHYFCSAAPPIAIPEVLPAAMIRFAVQCAASAAVASVSWATVASLIQGQITLVLALRCPQAAVGWIIPGIEDAMHTMVAYWLQPILVDVDDQGRHNELRGGGDEGVVAATTAGEASASASLLYDHDKDDWWNLARTVTQACTNLLKAGWLPTTIVMRERLLDGILIVAAKASMQGVSSYRSLGGANDDHGSDEHVADASTRSQDYGLAESVAALAAMGRLIPPSRLVAVVEALCRLKVVAKRSDIGEGLSADKVATALNANDEQHHHQQQQHAPAAADPVKYCEHQSCVVDIDRLMEMLLANDSLSSSVMEALFRIVNAVVDPDLSPLYQLEQDQAFSLMVVEQATVAIGDQAVAMWHGAPYLRVYWHALLQCLHQMLATIVQWEKRDGCTTKGLLGHAVYSLASTCLFSLRLVIDMELRGGTGSLLVDPEWETIVLCLKEGVLPWIESKAGDESTLSGAIAFFTQLGEFLNNSAQVGKVPFADFTQQMELYEFLLRDAAPCLPEHLSRPLGTSVVKCWAKYGLFPYRLIEWRQTVSRLLEVAFSTSEDGTYYVQPPEVRLEALRVLRIRDENNVQLQDEGADEPKKTRIPPMLVLTQHLREQYLDLVGTSVIPALMGLLCGNAVRHDRDCAGKLLEMETRKAIEAGCACKPYEMETTTQFERSLSKDAVRILCRGICTSSALCPLDELELFAVRTVGSLYRAASGDKSHRAAFILMFQSVARNRALTNDKTAVSSEDMTELSHSFSVRMAAINEMKCCLEASFSSLPHSQETVPFITSALCAVLDDYTRLLRVEAKDLNDSRLQTILTAAALDPLSRLQVGADGQISFQLSRCRPDDEVTDVIGGFLEKQETFALLQQSPSFEAREAPFLATLEHGLKCKTKAVRTAISFIPILQSVVAFLVASLDPTREYDANVEHVTVCMRVSCFSLMSSLVFVKVDSTLLRDILLKVFIVRIPKESIDNSAMNKTFGLYVQTYLAQALSAGEDFRTLEEVKTACRLFVGSLGSMSDRDCIARMRMIPSLIPTLQELERREPSQEFLSDVLSLAERVDLTLRNPRKLNAVLCIVLDLLDFSRSPWADYPILSWFRLAYLGLMESTTEDDQLGYDALLAFRCVVALIDAADASGTREMKLFVESVRHPRNNGSLQSIILSMIRDCTNRPVDGGSSLVSRHHQLVVETNNIESFQVEKSLRLGNNSFASWLLGGHTLISFRVGATNSRYVGWLEIIVRTAFSRKRMLFQLPGYPSLDTPDPPFPVTAPGRSEKGVPVSEEEMCSSNDEKKSEPPEALARARTALLRFDMVMCSHEKEHDLQDAENVQQRQPEISSNEVFPTPVSWVRSISGSGNDAQLVVREVEAFLATIDAHSKGGSPVSSQRLAAGKPLERGIAVLDRVAFINNTHKVALLYDPPSHSRGSSLDTEARLLGALYCSPSFHRFAQRIGEMVPTHQLNYFSGGLDVSPHATDGEYALVWFDHCRTFLAATKLVVFHVSSLIPTNNVSRKRHIGNDNVLVVFSDVYVDLEHNKDVSAVLGGGFGFVTIFVMVIHPGVSRVSARVRKEHEAILGEFVCDSILAEECAPVFVRNHAMRADLACRAIFDESVESPSNILRRKEILHGMIRHVQ